MRLAVHRASEKEVALKVYHKDKLSAMQLEAARNEERVMKSLDHPNVLKVNDMFESPQFLVIVMPIMKMSLLDYLKERQFQLSEEEARQIFAKIVDAVDHCHRNGIMHCDLKPDNILINYDDFDELMTITELCIADFGLCQATSKLNPIS